MYGPSQTPRAPPHIVTYTPHTAHRDTGTSLTINTKEMKLYKDGEALIDSVLHASEEEIPVVIFDSALGDEKPIVTYVATDNYQGGKLAAETLAESLGGKGDVILLRYNPGSESTESGNKASSTN